MGTTTKLTPARKRELRWEIIDAAFDRIEILCEQDGLTQEEEVYMRSSIRRAAAHLNVKNHIYL
jgi:hypothetical protein